MTYDQLVHLIDTATKIKNGEQIESNNDILNNK